MKEEYCAAKRSVKSVSTLLKRMRKYRSSAINDFQAFLQFHWRYARYSWREMCKEK